MNLSLAFTRTLFFILSIFFISFYLVAGANEYSWTKLGLGVLGGSLFGSALIGFDILFKRFNLRSFNIATLGLFFGYLMGAALVLIFSAILEISAASIRLTPETLEISKILLFLFGIYLGTLITLKASDELYISIPFVRFSAAAQKKKDLLLDSSLLGDARIIDLASSSLVDAHLVLPRFIVKDLYAQSEAADETHRVKAKKCLDNIKKLEGMSHLEMRYNDTDFPEIKDSMTKMTRLAKLIDANILTADTNQIQIPPIEGIRFINLHDLSKALKPLMQMGELLKIKIQRYGKEPRQGVGYLEDGTMVVVNGGGQFIGETIEALVLSVKHTSSGRIVFCNTTANHDGLPYMHHDMEDA
jgi:uncharacterized protein YacL